MTAFGGPAAHIAIMEQVFVRKLGLIQQKEFSDLIGATNLIPGPNSTEMAIHIGYILRGYKGMATALFFILPSLALTYVFAIIYVIVTRSPDTSDFLLGVKPVVIAIIWIVVFRLSRTNNTTPANRKLALGIFVLGSIGYLGQNQLLSNPIFLIFLAAVAELALGKRNISQSKVSQNAIRYRNSLIGISLWLGVGIIAYLLSLTAIRIFQIFWFFYFVGSVLFGSGYILVAFVQQGAVNDYGWITTQQLIDAIAVGQVTPGPVLSTSTFIGYIAGGTIGAVVASAGIFLPSFFFVLAMNPIMKSMRNSQKFSRFLDGATIGSIMVMLLVSFSLLWDIIFLAPTSSVRGLLIIFTLACALILHRYKIPPTMLIVFGIALGFIIDPFL